MHVVHSGYQQTVAKINHLCILTIQRRQIARNSYHTPVVTDSDISVLKHFEMAFLLREEDMGFIDFLHTIILVRFLQLIRFCMLTTFGNSVSKSTKQLSLQN